MYRRFDFEGDTHESLACVPLVVRRKLDLAALKISLAGWQSLSREERLALCHLPVDAAADLAVYREVLSGFAGRAGAALTPLAPADPADWAVAAVGARLRERLGAEAPSEALIGALSEEERYALHKLAEPKRTPEKLRAALAELERRPAGDPATKER